LKDEREEVIAATFTRAWPGPGNSDGPVDPEGPLEPGPTGDDGESQPPIRDDELKVNPWPGPGDSEGPGGA